MGVSSVGVQQRVKHSPGAEFAFFPVTEGAAHPLH